MRHIGLRQIIKYKCPICGSKNKVHSELIDEDFKFVGYSLKCCNCGNYNEFLLDAKNNGKCHRSYKVGKQSCIQLSFCKFCNNPCKLPKFDPRPKPCPHPLPYDENINRDSIVHTYYVEPEKFL